MKKKDRCKDEMNTRKSKHTNDGAQKRKEKKKIRKRRECTDNAE